MAGYRGRLIFPFMGRFALVNPAGIAADPDLAGPETSGYDDDFRESIMVPGPPGSPARGVDVRAANEDLIDIPFQEDLERYADSNRPSPLLSGDSPDAQIFIIFHFADLERLALVDVVTGRPLIKRDDRLVSVHNFTTSALIQEVRTPPGLYIHSLTPAFGFRQTRNLLFAELRPRELSVQGPP